MIVQPGVGANLAELGGTAVVLATTETPDIGQLIVNIVPSNPVQAFASGDMLQIIFMAIITGLAIQALDKKGGPAINAFQIANDIMMKLVSLIMSFAPFGVFALMIQLGATLDGATLGFCSKLCRSSCIVTYCLDSSCIPTSGMGNYRYPSSYVPSSDS